MYKEKTIAEIIARPSVMIGIAKKALINPAMMSKISEMNSMFPSWVRSRLVFVAITDIVAKMSPVLPAARPTIVAPFLSASVACSTGPQSRPIKKVNISSSATPYILFLHSLIAQTKKNAKPKIRMQDNMGAEAKNDQLNCWPRAMPAIVGNMLIPSNCSVCESTLELGSSLSEVFVKSMYGNSNSRWLFIAYLMYLIRHKMHM